MDLLLGRVADADPALEMAATTALLRRVADGGVDSALRVFRPTPMVAFGRRDANRPGFPAAAQACREAGFTPVVRASGGRAVACTSSTIVLDHVQHDPTSPGGMEARFQDFGAMLADVLADFGIDARVGEVPGEYCAGAHSVNAGGTVKLIGTAQRMVRHAWLFSSVVIFDDAARLRPLLADVYAALELPFDPASVGAVATEAPRTTLDVLEQAFIGAYDDRFGLVESRPDEALLAAARALVPDHVGP
ncbi:lipoate--protein ligase family protein [Tessaracoccus rhinocerotis]|uniref:Lipoate--protein ligase family protein n=1 Tax=Tessaracoccus rhinocerotis TaxID=1689449 RepID=A0A553JXD3_9ACTN|nr:lipoate--protein ligase family protein [Tessaracoccus rhinocerotis]TRY17106.1 lipoate--protein ligase family protein [Tessaracoccus rhinocerotis]